MTTEQKIIKTKLGLLELGRQLSNVSEACRVMGYSRDSLETMKKRLLALEAKVAQEGGGPHRGPNRGVGGPPTREGSPRRV